MPSELRNRPDELRMDVWNCAEPLCVKDTFERKLGLNRASGATGTQRDKDLRYRREGHVTGSEKVPKIPMQSRVLTVNHIHYVLAWSGLDRQGMLCPSDTITSGSRLSCNCGPLHPDSIASGWVSWSRSKPHIRQTVAESTY